MKLGRALRSTTSGEPLGERALRGLWRFGEGAGLVLVFASGSLLALLSYINLPAGKRLVARGLEQVLSSTFYGNFTIDAIDHVSLRGVQARGITVKDPDGRVVLTVSALAADADLVGILRKVLYGTGTVTIKIDHARAEKAEVFVVSTPKSDIPTIADAFLPLPSKNPSAPSTPSSQKIKVWLPSIEVGHIYGRVSLEGVPTLETEITNVHGSVIGAPDLTSVDVERFAMVARGLGGADARGVGSVHVRAPGAVWTSFDGYFGDVQLGTVVKVDSPKLDITVDVPRAEAEDVRALWQGYPLLKDVGAHVEAVGTVHSLHTQAKVLVGRGAIDATGEVRLSGDPGADLDVSGRGLNLQALFPTVPETQLDADATVSVFQSDGEIVADVSGSTHETRVLGVPVPAIDVTGSYNKKGFDAKGTLHEPGAPIKATVQIHPDGSVDATAQAKHIDLPHTPRLAPLFKGKGVADLELKAHIAKGKLDAHVDADVRDFEAGPVTFKSSKVSGRASGPLGSPDQLNLDFSAQSQMFRAGPIGFDELDSTAKGPLSRPAITALVKNNYGPAISAKARVTTIGKPHVDDLAVELRRDQDVLTATVAHLGVEGDEVLVNGLSVQGAGGKLDASGQLGPEHLALVAQGEGLDLEVIAHTLGLPRGVLSGKLALDADLDSTKKNQRGSLLLKLQKGQIDGVAVDSGSLATQLIGPRLDVQATAQLRDFGNFAGEARTNLDGSLGDLHTLERATGTLTVTGERMPLGLLSYALPKTANVSEVRGEANATIVLSREQPTAIPSASVLVNTDGLYVAMAPKAQGAEPLIVKGIDVHAGVNVNGDTGQTDATLKLGDAHGQLIAATTSLKLDLETATKHPEQIPKLLYTTPLVAKAVIEDRSIEDLPKPIVPAGIAGRIRTEASLRGTLEKPVFSDKTELFQLRLGESERDKAIDVCAQLDYNKTTGEYGARGELFLPSTATRACKGTRVAQFSGAGTAEWAKLVSAELNADAAWTGTIGVSLEGLPLGFVPPLAEAGIDGKVLGAIMFDRRQALPQMVAHLEVRDAVVARTKVGTAGVDARTDGRTLNASLAVHEALGDIAGDVQTSINWQGAVPGIDDTRPISAHLKATQVDAVLLSPLLRDVLSEIGGKLTGDLTARFTPDLNPNAEQRWNTALQGSMALHAGTLQLARLALRMRNVELQATAAEDSGSTLITIPTLSAAAESESDNVRGSASIRLQGFRVVTGNASVALSDVPLLVEGVTLATLSAQKNIDIALERRQSEMFVGLKIPDLTAKLPNSASRSLIVLGDNTDIQVAQPLAEPKGASDGEALPWHLRFDLGNSGVRVTRSDLYLPLSGSPEILLGDTLKVQGNVTLAPGGRLSLLGLPHPFTIESGSASFDPDGDPSDPRILVFALCEAPQVTVRARVSGTLNKADIELEDVDDPSITDSNTILAKLLNAPSEENTNAAGATGLSAGTGLIGQRLFANTALANLQIKAGSETAADQRSYNTYSASYPITDTIWFEGSYKTLQTQDQGVTNSNAVSGTLDWRFRKNWSLRSELGTIGMGVDLLWQYKY